MNLLNSKVAPISQAASNRRHIPLDPYRFTGLLAPDSNDPTKPHDSVVPVKKLKAKFPVLSRHIRYPAWIGRWTAPLSI